jgi:polysaccharide deacetylase family protein (PEP-CTERM system associated)
VTSASVSREPRFSRGGASPVRATLTLDVEDWEHANYPQLRGREAVIAASVREARYAMDASTDRWIEILGRAGARSTCFVLGEFAQRYPDAVRRLARAGHEMATHGATHALVYEMARAGFREWLRRGIGVLGEVTGEAPLGFRAPSWSVDRNTPWLVEELLAAGLRYDASVFPVQTALFGNEALPLEAYRETSASATPIVSAPSPSPGPEPAGSGLLRIPLTVATVAGHRVPMASGVFRVMPRAFLHWSFRQAARSGRPVMIVLHPRELDPAHPRLPLTGWARRAHYAGLRSVVPKLESLLGSWAWGSIRDVYGPGYEAPQATAR